MPRTKDQLPDDWQPPKPRQLGWKGLTDAQIKAEARLPTRELNVVQARAATAPN